MSESIITFKGKEISEELEKYTAIQLKSAVINENSEVIKALSNDGGLAYIRMLNGKTKAGAFIYANADEVLPVWGTGLGLMVTFLTGGAGFAAIPAGAAAGVAVADNLGAVKGEKKMLTNTSLKVKEILRQIALKEATISGDVLGIASAEIGVTKIQMYVAVFVFLVVIYLAFKNK